MVRVTWLDSESATNQRSALLLPGAGYTAQAPLLYWTTAVLLAAGWRVCAAEWEDRDRELASPYHLIDRAFELYATESSGPVDLVVAKSLGSLALPRCIDEGIAGVWLTPLLNETEIARALRSADRRHLAVGGTKDRHWIPEAVHGTDSQMIAFEGVDHALLHEDWRVSMQMQSDVVSAVDAHVRAL